MTTRIGPPLTVAVAVALLLGNFAMPDIISLVKYGSFGTATWFDWWISYLVVAPLILGLACALWRGWRLSRALAVILMAVNLYYTVPLQDELAQAGLTGLWLEDVVLRIAVVGLLTIPAPSRRWFGPAGPNTVDAAPTVTGGFLAAAPQTPPTVAVTQPAGYRQGAWAASQDWSPPGTRPVPPLPTCPAAGAPSR